MASTTALARLSPCGRNSDGPAIAAALHAIRASVDPCGESPELAAMLATVARCAPGRYQICTDRTIQRNVLDRPMGSEPRTITWNPVLRSVLEPASGDDPTSRVLRDPTASLVHELVHAAQDCEGLNPGEHELEAVRLENVYRRAAGLWQRHRYGDELLPPEMVRTCTPADCSCSLPIEVARPASPARSAARAPGREMASSGDSLPLCEDR